MTDLKTYKYRENNMRERRESAYMGRGRVGTGGDWF
jgi:hypothetical protein